MSDSSFRTERRVEFCETDAAGIVHFSAFTQYMEQAEHQLLRSLGLSVFSPTWEDEGHVSWPRVRVECDYHGAAKFEDVLEITVDIVKLGSKSVTYAFQFRKGEAKIASGRIVVVCCLVQAGKPLQSVEIPAEIREKLNQHLVVSE